MSECPDRYRFDREKREAAGADIVGVDEAGRGPLAGPVVAAAVVLDLDKPIDGLNDSKKLSEKRRNELCTRIRNEAVFCGVGIVGPERIDKINILQATFQAMNDALAGAPAAFCLVDGNHPVPGVDPSRQEAVIKGDGKSASVGAASIVAKVTRDALLYELDAKYPAYGFAAHKGYGTARHRSAIVQFGLTPEHRKSFCHTLIQQTRLAL